MSEKSKVHLVFIGTRLGSKDKKFFTYYEIDENWNDGRKLNPEFSRVILFSKELGYCGIGGIATADKEPSDKGGNLWSNFGATGEKWGNEEDRVTWQAQTRANESYLKNKRDSVKNKYEDVDEYIDVLAKTYWNLPVLHREAFLAYVISGIMGNKYK